MIQSYILLDPKMEISAKQGVNTLVVEPIDGKDIGIQEIRQFNRWAAQTSFASGIKRGVILQAHKLSRDAQQALLKTLEEPVEDTQLVLTVDQADRLLPTIQSRCATVDPFAEGDRLLAEFELTRSPSGEVADVSLDFIDLQNKSELERWQAMDKVVSQKGNLAVHLHAWHLQLIDRLHQSTGSKVQTIRHIECIDQSLSALQSNVAPKLVADKLLLDLAP